MILNPFTTLNNTDDNVTYYLSKTIKNYSYSNPLTFVVPDKSLCCVLRVGTDGASVTNSDMDKIQPLAYFYYDKTYSYDNDSVRLIYNASGNLTSYFEPRTGKIITYSSLTHYGNFGMLFIITDLSNKQLTSI